MVELKVAAYEKKNNESRKGRNGKLKVLKWKMEKRREVMKLYGNLNTEDCLKYRCRD